MTAKQVREALKKFEDYKQLTGANQVDVRILRDNVESEIFRLEELREADWNPLVYNQSLANSLYLLVARDFDSAEKRIPNLRDRMEAIPVVIKQAEENLQHPVVQLAVVRSIPWLVKAVLCIQVLLAKIGQEQDPPTVDRLAAGIGDVGRWEGAVGLVVIVEGQLDRAEVAGALRPPGRLAGRFDGAAHHRQQSAGAAQGEDDGQHSPDADPRSPVARRLDDGGGLVGREVHRPCLRRAL